MPSLHSPCISKCMAKVQKKIAVCKYLGKKVCVLTIHFAQIPLYINKVSENRQKREGDGSVNESPSRAFSPLYKGLPDEKGRKGGTFQFSEYSRFIKSSHLPYRQLAPSTINDNYQSDGFGLAVRNYRTRSPSRRTNLSHSRLKRLKTSYSISFLL